VAEDVGHVFQVSVFSSSKIKAYAHGHGLAWSPFDRARVMYCSE